MPWRNALHHILRTSHCISMMLQQPRSDRFFPSNLLSCRDKESLKSQLHLEAIHYLSGCQLGRRLKFVKLLQPPHFHQTPAFSKKRFPSLHDAIDSQNGQAHILNFVQALVGFFLHTLLILKSQFAQVSSLELSPSHISSIQYAVPFKRIIICAVLSFLFSHLIAILSSKSCPSREKGNLLCCRGGWWTNWRKWITSISYNDNLDAHRDQDISTNDNCGNR